MFMSLLEISGATVAYLGEILSDKCFQIDQSISTGQSGFLGISESHP